jgi:hypothetical protein
MSIEFEIYSKQPPKALRKHNDSYLVGHIMPFILERRMIKLNGFSDVVPNIITSIVNIISPYLDTLTGLQRQNLRGSIYQTVGRGSPYVWNLALMPRKKKVASDSTDTNGRDEALVVAMGLRYRKLACALIANGSSPWGQTDLFGRTWIWIASNCDVAEIHFLINQISGAALSKDTRVRAAQKCSLGNQIMKVLQLGKEPSTRALLDYYLDLGTTTPTERFCKEMLKIATDVGAHRTLDHLLSTEPFAQHADHLRVQFLGQYSYHDHVGGVIRTLWEHNIFNRLNLNDPQPEPKPWPLMYANRNTQSLLDIAVFKLDKQLVVDLIRNGANPDGVMLNIKKLSYPLRQAIQLGGRSVVDVLLHFRADPMMGMSATEAKKFVEQACENYVCEKRAYKNHVCQKHTCGMYVDQAAIRSRMEGAIEQKEKAMCLYLAGIQSRRH